MEKIFLEFIFLGHCVDYSSVIRLVWVVLVPPACEVIRGLYMSVDCYGQVHAFFGCSKMFIVHFIVKEITSIHLFALVIGCITVHFKIGRKRVSVHHHMATLPQS